MLKKSWKHFWKNGIVQKDSTGRIKSEKYKEDLEEWTRTRRFVFSLDDLQMVISSLTLITSKLSDVELVSMQELALRPISFSVWVNSHYIVPVVVGEIMELFQVVQFKTLMDIRFQDRQ